MEPQGPRRKTRLFAQPHQWGSAQRAGAGRGDGVLTPSPSPFSARHKPGAAPAQAPSSPPRQTRPAEAKPLGKAPPSSSYLQTPSPCAAVNGCRMLRMRDGEQSACALRAFGLSLTFGLSGLEKGKKSREKLKYIETFTDKASTAKRTRTRSWKKLNLILRNSNLDRCILHEEQTVSEQQQLRGMET